MTRPQLQTTSPSERIRRVDQAGLLGLDLAAVGPDWARGCDRCHNGVMPSTPALRNHLPIWEQRLGQYNLGLLDCCDCKAGQTLAKWCINHAEDRDIPDIVRQAKDDYAARARQRLFDDASVPPRYAAYTLAGFPARDDPAKREAVAAITSLYKTGAIGNKNGLLLYGPPGVGKTGMLSPLITANLKAGHTVLWVQYNELMRQMRDFQSGLVGEREEHCKTVAYLMIDDLGDPLANHTATDWSRDVLFRIINHRRDNDLPMLITTNLTPAQIAAQFGDRLARRIADVCAVVEVGGRVL